MHALAAVLFLVALTVPVVAVIGMLRRRNLLAMREARTHRRASRTLAARAFAVYRNAGDNPGRTWDGRHIPRWEELTDRMRDGWAAFTLAVDAVEGYERYAAVVRCDVLGRPMPAWVALTRETQARWALAFAALLGDPEGREEEETDSGEATACRG
jgi:hypothetical protein